MGDKSVVEKLLDRASLAIILVGALIFTIAAVGGLPIGNPPLEISNNAWRLALGILGGVLIAVGLLLVILESKSDVTRTAKNNTTVGKADKAAFIDRFFTRQWPDSLADDIKRSKDLLLIGMSLTRTIKSIRDLLPEKLSQGDTIRILLINPEHFASAIAANRPFQPDIEQSRNRIRENLKNLSELQQKMLGRLEIRTIDYPLTIGGIFIETDTNQGTLYLEHYTYKVKTPYDDLPKFVLHNEDGEWYKRFKEQGEILWREGKQWQEIE